jgi:hypothetical protein
MQLPLRKMEAFELQAKLLFGIVVVNPLGKGHWN